MTDEFVTRAKFDAMVAERDALVASTSAQVTEIWNLQTERNRLSTERDAALRRERHLTASLAAAHGLQARAERAEAALAEMRTATLGVIDAVNYMVEQKCSVPMVAITRCREAWNLCAALAAVPS